MVELAAQIYRDFNTDGDPSSGPHKPVKAEVREWGTWAEGYFGGAFDVDITISKSYPTIYLNKAAAGENATIEAETGGIGRWSLVMSNYEDELGGNTGSNLNLVSKDDAGAPIDVVLEVIRSTGRIRLGCGQLTFPDTQNPANEAWTLDDYEEGTFTPRIIGTGAAGTGTYSVRVGRYTKIGERVIGEIEMTWSAHTGTTNMKIADLPFTSGNRKSPVSLSFSGLTFAAALHGYVEASSTTIALFTSATGAAETALPIDTAATLRVSFTYSVN